MITSDWLGRPVKRNPVKIFLESPGFGQDSLLAIIKAPFSNDPFPPKPTEAEPIFNMWKYEGRP